MDPDPIDLLVPSAIPQQGNVAGANKIQTRNGIGLCLSGGGYRAALFHLGALRRLNEVGLLGKIDTISAVSGGSIIAGFLASRLRPWPKPGEIVSAWNSRIAEPFYEFVRQDIRTVPLLLDWSLGRLFPGIGCSRLADHYDRLFKGLTLAELPDTPKFVFCATDMIYGVNWISEKEKVGHYRAGYCSRSDWKLARVVAYSSCFPPLFSPSPTGIPPEDFHNGNYQPKEDRLKLNGQISLTDGGVYDNLGTEAVWKNHQTILVSDGGGKLPFESTWLTLSRIKRYSAIIQNQAISLRMRMLFSMLNEEQVKGGYWGLSGDNARYSKDPHIDGYSAELVSSNIQKIRTDLSYFTSGEIAVLENHAYLLTDATLKRRAPQILPAGDTPVGQVPFPSWMDEVKVRQTLTGSHSLLGGWPRIRKQFFGGDSF